MAAVFLQIISQVLRKILALILTMLALGINIGLSSPPDKIKETTRTIMSFDQDWRFKSVDSIGAEKSNFDDSSWRLLNIPHDWSIEGAYDAKNPTGEGGGYLPAGIGWYRKTFVLPDEYAKRQVSIEFDGVMANSDVWINGHHLGNRPNGYVSFSYELTGHLNFGKNKINVIAVRADNSKQPASRWYTGAGIYRHVRLVATQPVHISHWGVYITTPEVTDLKATVRVNTSVTNQSSKESSFVLKTTLKSPGGQTIQSTESMQVIAAGKSVIIKQDLVVSNPQLWNLDKPNIYLAASNLYTKDNQPLDDNTTSFGIRQIRFDASSGFSLNNVNLKLKGVCLHHEAGGLGAAVPLRAWERRLERLKQIGVNAIRTSHNSTAPEFLDLCDRMGFLVMDETFDVWETKKANAAFGYNLYFSKWWDTDIRSIVERDRNHPCIVIYSVGNEIHDNLNNEDGFRKYKQQQDLIHQLDSTRPVTMALFRPNSSNVYKNGFAELMDVVGQNYREPELIAYHNEHPNSVIIGTENGHAQRVWVALRDNPFMCGQFLWTGIDYLGESKWPIITRNSGLLDRTGALKPRAYERQSWWSNDPMVNINRTADSTEVLESDGSDGEKGIARLTHDWTPLSIEKYKNANIQVYSNCDEIEVFLNNKSVFSKTLSKGEDGAAFRISFESGAIKVVGKIAGKVVATDELRTAGKPEKIVLTADKSSIANTWDDISYITAKIVDSNGVQCPASDQIIKFEISGPGSVAAVDNGNLSSHELFKASQRQTYQGQCIAIVRATASSGEITIKASADMLKGAEITVKTTE